MRVPAKIERSLLRIRDWKGFRRSYDTIPDVFSKLHSLRHAQLHNFFEGERRYIFILSFLSHHGKM